MPEALAALALERPLGLAFLLLPLALLLLATRRARPRTLATGTFALWEGVGATGGGRLRRPPAWVLLCALALALGALALAGPRRPARTWRTWIAVVDRSPSMGLPAPEGGARHARAVERAAAFLGELAGPRDRVLWRAAGRAELRLGPGEAPPPAWSAPPAWSLPEPDAALLDAPGVLVVTDAPPEPPMLAAGFVACGARPTPGPIGLEAGEGTGGERGWRLDWDGETVTRVRDATPPRAVRALGEGAPLPDPVGRVVAAWAAARGLVLGGAGGAADGGRVALVVEDRTGGGAGRACVLGRDGWSAPAVVPVEGLGPPDGGEGPGEDSLRELPPRETWLRAPPAPSGTAGPADAVPVVDAAPGRVRLAVQELGEPAGDPAAFAVSWAELFDRSALPVPGTVPLDERALAGPAGERAPRPGPVAGEEAGPAGADSWLAALAALVLVAALGVRGARRGAGRQTSTRP